MNGWQINEVSLLLCAREAEEGQADLRPPLSITVDAPGLMLKQAGLSITAHWIHLLQWNGDREVNQEDLISLRHYHNTAPGGSWGRHSYYSQVAHEKAEN